MRSTTVAWGTCCLTALAVAGCNSYRGASVIGDYAVNIKCRKESLEELSKEKEHVCFVLWDHINRGGILFLRDYLVFMAEKYPEERSPLSQLRICKDKLQNEPVVLGWILNCDRLAGVTGQRKGQMYSYAEVARMIERTHRNWKISASAGLTDLMGDYLAAPRPVFDWVEAELDEPKEPPLPKVE